jgi:hypothetical protein
VVSLSFTRVDADTIRVEFTGGARRYRFDVTTAGAISAGEEMTR